MPEKVVPLADAASGKGKKKKRRIRLGSSDDDDEEGHISQIIREHAFAFFIQQGGNEEDWEETREQSVRWAWTGSQDLILTKYYLVVREEMLRRWRETEWGTIWGRRQSKGKEPKQAKRWIGGSFEVGDILGVNILAEPAESIRERMSNRSARSASQKPPAASSSHLPLSVDEGVSAFFTPEEGATSFFAPEPPGGSTLRPTLSVGVAENDVRRAQSDFAARPTLELSTAQVKSDSHVPGIGKQRERAVHYAESPVREVDSPAPPSAVLERSLSQLPDTSAQAMRTPDPPSNITMRGQL
jgi:hypothetical protein